jgi:two-component system, OmpR family, response regulator
MRFGIIREYSARIARIAHPVVVVGDDDPAFRMLLRVNLELEGYRVLEAGGGDEIRKAIAGEDVALLLLDVRLGEDDGVALARELRAEKPELAIVFLTGSAYGLEQAAREITDDIIQKPFSLEELTETVGRLAPR